MSCFGANINIASSVICACPFYCFTIVDNYSVCDNCRFKYIFEFSYDDIWHIFGWNYTVDGITYYIKPQTTTLVLFGVWRINNSENPLMEYIYIPPETPLLYPN